MSPPATATPPPGVEVPQPPRERGWRARRLLIGAATLALLGAIVAIALVEGAVTGLQSAIDVNKPLTISPGTVQQAAAGGPQTLLLVGDDRRALTPYYHHAVASHSNEMLLVRIDPSKPWISMLSIPRELWVPITPASGPTVTNRINFAYTLGGITLMTQTIRRITGLSVNHVVVIDFGHFKRAVDQLGCVYTTVDHRYYHSNVGSVQQYQEINLQPGYQKLCGPQALQFVSYRHGDTSLIRDARNQSFLLDVKKQFGPDLASDPGKFENVFGQAVQTDADLHTKSGLLNLIALLAQSAGKPVRQVKFQVNLLPTYDTATPQQIAATVNQFLNGNPVAPKQRTAAVAHALHGHHGSAYLQVAPTPASALSTAKAAQAAVPFPIEYPRVRNQAIPAQADPDTIRTYANRDQQGNVHTAYVIVVSRGIAGQYYDVQGMGWTTAPMFDKPDQTVTVAGRTYSIYFEGSNVKMVAWYENGAVYWVRNTLTDDVSNATMLALAEETQPLGGHLQAPPARHAGLGIFGLPAREQVRTAENALLAVGPVAALIAWLGIVALAVRLFAGRRELAAARGEVATAVALEAHSRELAAQRGISLGGQRVRDVEPAPRSRRGLAAATALALVALAALAVTYALNTGTSTKTVQRAAVSVSTPVVVLNEGAAAGAAHQLASGLQAQGVRVASVGNAGAAIPGQAAGVEILYAAGSEQQAGQLARILNAVGPTLAPLDPTTAAAAGAGAKLVVVAR